MAAINLSKIAAGTGSLEITAHGMADASALDMAGGRGITTSIVFIDSRLEDCETLVADVSADSEWLLVDSDSDGLAQMQAALAGRSDLASIRILAHGRPGALLLGASELTHDEVDHHAVSLAMIGRALDAQGDVQIYGCEVGQGDTGCAFVDALAEAIGAPVAASSSPMGHAELGGGWWLDVGEARSPVLDRPQWRGLLGVTITPLAPSYPGRSAGEVRNGYAFAAVRADGSVVTWGHSTNGGNSSAVTAGLDGTIDVTQVFSTMSAFAALRANGSVVTWGNSTNGGDSSAVAAALDGTIDVTQLFSAQNAFAALRSDGSVVTWGYAPWGGDSSAVATAIDGTVAVTQVFSTTRAFAALRADGSVVAWGYDPGNGHGAASDTSTVAAALDGTIDVINVFSNSYAFSALRADGSVVSWGQDIYGGDQSDFGGVTAALDGTIDVTQVACTSTAFAALRADGSVVTWGQTDNSTLSPTNVTQLFSTAGAFAALRADGSVVTWGGSGGDSSAVATALNGTIDVTQVFSTMSAFAALRADGSVVTWGDDTYGGNSNAVAAALNGTIDVTQVFSTTTAFAALRADGSVVTWGFASSGGDSSSVAAALDGTIDVTEVFSTETAFAALRADGSVVTWGYGVDGGDSSAVASQLTNVVSMANPYTNDVFLAIPPIVGTAAADVLNGTAGDDILNGLAGDDTIHGGTGHDLLNGDDDNDQLYGDDGNDTLNGGDGADFIMGGTGVDAIDGGTGLDTVSYEDAAAGIVIDLASGSASNNGEGQVESVLNVENVHGTNFNDVIQLSASSGYVFARAGNDSITGGIGNDRFFAGSGNDTINGGAGTDIADYLDDGYDGLGAGTQGVTVDLGNGTATDNWGASDQLSGIESVNGSSMADDLIGNDVANALFGNDGNDSLNGGAGDDTLNGGDGADFIMGGTGVDAIDGGTGLDTVSYEDAAAGIVIDLASGSASNNGEGQVESVLNVENVHGTNFNDVIQLSASSGYVFARAGNDSITGGIGNDRFFAGSGNDTINGGAGTDIADYLDDGYDGLGAGTQGVTVDLGNGTATDNWGASDQLSGIESVNGSSMADDLIGNDVANALFGNDGNDSLNGGGGADTMIGGDGSDYYYVDDAGDIVVETNADLASGGNDLVYSYLYSYTLTDNVERLRLLTTGSSFATGNSLDNTLYAGDGNNVMNGGTGNDTVSYAYATSAVSVNLALGNAQATGGSGIDTLKNVENLTGSNYNDWLRGDSGNNVLEGGDGNDSLNGEAGADTLIGGDGTDYYYVENAGDVVIESNADLATGGNDLVYSYLYSYTLTDNVERLRLLTPGSSFATGNSLDNTLYAGDGNNVMDGGTGNDTVSYAYAKSAISVNLALGNAQATGGSGIDTLKNIENLAGSNFNDWLRGDGSNNVLEGNDGNDSLNGEAGADTLIGGNGTDYYYVDDAGDLVIESNADLATGGNDLVYSYIYSYTLTDNVERLRLLTTGSSFATGNGLDNLLYAGDGNNVMDGAGGNDTVSYAYATSGVSVNLAIGKAQATGGSGTDTLKNVENLVGSNFNDDLRGDTAANQLDGGNGNDSLNGSAGADTMVGGDGTDYYYVDDAGDVVVESNANPASGGNDLVYSYVYSYTLTDNVERLRILNPGSCFATGNSLDNTLYAGDGNNVMNGAGGNDTVSYAYATSGVDVSLATGKAQVTGGSGTDTLKNVENLAGSRFGDYLGGNNAANELAGGNGNDTLNGGLGNDTLIGGAGSDTIRFDTLLDALNNNDTITDFNVVADRIELENAIFASLTSTGTLAAGSFHSGVGVSATDADDFILYDSSSGALSYDADGNGAGAAVQFATLASGLALSSADFLVT